VDLLARFRMIFGRHRHLAVSNRDFPLAVACTGKPELTVVIRLFHSLTRAC
jgi:hypothetical protein